MRMASQKHMERSKLGESNGAKASTQSIPQTPERAAGMTGCRSRSLRPSKFLGLVKHCNCSAAWNSHCGELWPRCRCVSAGLTPFMADCCSQSVLAISSGTGGFTAIRLGWGIGVVLAMLLTGEISGAHLIRPPRSRSCCSESSPGAKYRSMSWHRLLAPSLVGSTSRPITVSSRTYSRAAMASEHLESRRHRMASLSLLPLPGCPTLVGLAVYSNR